MTMTDYWSDKLMLPEERAQYGDSIYDDLRMLCMLRREQRDEGGHWCISCGAHFSESLIKHLARHIAQDIDKSTFTPPPEFS